MGFGLPAALGVKMALPDETVVCVTGDGSIQMNIQELSTALQYEDGAYIISELELLLSGMDNNIDIEDLLLDFGERSGNEDIESFAKVFQICYRKGGNIKDTVRSTYEILNDKMEIAEDIETVVTANKTEQNVMLIMPIGLIGMMKMMSPDFAENFVSPSGIMATTVAVIIFVAAYFIGRKVLEIKI
jgi:tight adherence protein B